MVKGVEGGSARVNDLDRVRERMRIEHRADEGDIARAIVNDNDGPRWGRGGLVHNGISSLRFVQARHARHRSGTSLDIYVQNGFMMLLCVDTPHHEHNDTYF